VDTGRAGAMTIHSAFEDSSSYRPSRIFVQYSSPSLSHAIADPVSTRFPVPESPDPEGAVIVLSISVTLVTPLSGTFVTH